MPSGKEHSHVIGMHSFTIASVILSIHCINPAPYSPTDSTHSFQPTPISLRPHHLSFSISHEHLLRHTLYRHPQVMIHSTMLTTKTWTTQIHISLVSSYPPIHYFSKDGYWNNSWKQSTSSNLDSITGI